MNSFYVNLLSILILSVILISCNILLNKMIKTNHYINKFLFQLSYIYASFVLIYIPKNSNSLTLSPRLISIFIMLCILCLILCLIFYKKNKSVLSIIFIFLFLIFLQFILCNNLYLQNSSEHFIKTILISIILISSFITSSKIRKNIFESNVYKSNKKRAIKYIINTIALCIFHFICVYISLYIVDSNTFSLDININNFNFLSFINLFISLTYFASVALTTVGFGDIYPTSISGQIAVIMQVLTTFLVVVFGLDFFTSNIKNDSNCDSSKKEILDKINSLENSIKDLKNTIDKK